MTNTPLHLLFLDWKQAFGSIDHTAMLEALRKFGLSDAMIQLVSSPQIHGAGFHWQCRGRYSFGWH